jgi:hypothetical protein
MPPLIQASPVPRGPVTTGKYIRFATLHLEIADKETPLPPTAITVCC